jgi:ribosomal-protein-alanine N-acetyltransferase
MLTGTHVTLRPTRETDLKLLYDVHLDLSNRGDYFPLQLVSESQFIKDFRDTGFLTPERGTLLIIDRDDRIVGRVQYYPTVPYLSELELGYHIFDRAERGKGIASEAIRLLARYLFDTRPVNRLRLIIHTENAASRRLAEKCSFRHESTSRGAWFHGGRYQDVEVYALLREEAASLDPAT